MKTNFKGIVGIIVFVFITTSQISAQDNVIQGCVNVKNGNLRIVISPNECGIKESYISWNIEGPQGPPGQQGEPGVAGADGLSCWDLNENYFCDFETEDKNNDNMCDVLDCQASPAEGNVKVYSADDSYLGLLINSAPIEAGPFSSVPPSITVYVPDLKKLFQVSTGYYGENIWEPIPNRQNGYPLDIYFDGELCSGKPYILPGELYDNERFQMVYHIVTYKHLNGDVKHYQVINRPEVISIKSRHSLIGKTCENYPKDSKYYELNEVDLPFPYPVDLPLSFK